MRIALTDAGELVEPAPRPPGFARIDPLPFAGEPAGCLQSRECRVERSGADAGRLGHLGPGAALSRLCQQKTQYFQCRLGESNILIGHGATQSSTLIGTRYSPISTSDQGLSGEALTAFMLGSAEAETMYVHPIDRAALRTHVAAIEAKYPIKIIGILPRGSAGHLFDVTGLDLLGEKKQGLSLLDLCGAEVDLADLLGRPVGIVLVSGLRGREAEEFPRLVQPI
jgi:hypothetical protein